MPNHRLAIAAAAAALAPALPATAHDFWIQPSRFQQASGAPLSLTLQVGHGPYRQRSAIPPGRITRFAEIAPDGRAADRRLALSPGGAQADGALSLQGPGAHVLVLETDDRAESHLPAIRFNDYLKVEGLTPAIEARAKAHRTDTDGSESYSRRAKALIQVGPAGAGSQAQAIRPLGLPLEITPEVSPYALPRSARLPVRVTWQGRPLAGALVKLTDLDHDAAPLETHLTDKAGRAVFAMPHTGSWLLNVIWTRQQPPTRATDFETVFSSLSFGVPG